MTKFKPQLGRHGLELEARDVPAALDPTFGTSGTAIFGTANTASPISYGTTTDGSILTVAKDGTQGSFGVRRLTPAGAPDTAYDGNGTLELDALLASKRGVRVPTRSATTPFRLPRSPKRGAASGTSSRTTLSSPRRWTTRRFTIGPCKPSGRSSASTTTEPWTRPTAAAASSRRSSRSPRRRGSVTGA